MQAQDSLNLLYRAGLRKNFRDEWDKFETQYPFYLKTEGINGPEIEATIITGPSRLLETRDLQALDYAQLKQGPKVAAVDKEFALGMAIGLRTKEDDKYGKAMQMSRHLAHAGRMTYEYRAAELLDDAFAGSTFKGIDGLSLINASHTFLNHPVTGTTWSNLVTNNVGLSLTGINALMEIFQTMKDHNGDPIPMKMDKIVIGNNNGDELRLMQIMKSSLEPFTTGNQDNATGKKLGAVSHQVNVFKTSTKSYFGINSRYNDAWLLVRRPMTFEDWYDTPTRSSHSQAHTRFLRWFIDPRGWAGSNPT